MLAVRRFLRKSPTRIPVKSSGLAKFVSVEVLSPSGAGRAPEVQARHFRTCVRRVLELKANAMDEYSCHLINPRIPLVLTNFILSRS